MIGGAIGDGLSWAVGGDGLSLSGGAGSPLEGVDGWHRSMIGGAAVGGLGVGVGGVLSWSGGTGLPMEGLSC